MKKSIFITTIFLVVCLFLNITTINAATAASANISSSKSNVTVGDTVNVTVNFTAPVGAAGFIFNYDSSVFTCSSVSSGAKYNKGTGKVGLISTDPISSVTFTLKAEVIGNGNFSISGFTSSDVDGKKYTSSIGKSSVSVTSNKVPDPVKPKPVDPDPVKPKPVNPQPVKPQPVKPEEAKPEVVKPEEAKPEVVKPEEAKPEVVKPEVPSNEQEEIDSLKNTNNESGFGTFIKNYWAIVLMFITIIAVSIFIFFKRKMAK